MELVYLAGMAVMLFIVIFILIDRFGVSTKEEPKSDHGKVPGLKASDPETGNFPDIAKAGSFQEFLELLHEQYGGIASFWWNKTWTVSISQPSLFKEQNRIFDRPPELFALFEPFITAHSIQYANGEDGKHRRQIYDRPFGHEAMAKYYRPFNELAGALVKKWLSVPTGQHIALNRAMFNLAIRGITSTSLGVYFDEDEKVDHLADTYHKLWNAMEEVLHGRSMDKSFMEKFNSDKKVLYDVMKEACDMRLQNPPQEEDRVFIDVLLESGLSNEVIEADFVTYLVGGLHTTGNMLTWAMYYVGAHHDVQEKVFKEIENVVNDSDITMEHVSELVYTRQVLDETLRCSVLAPYAARVEDKDNELGGYTIPAGTPVVQALGVALQDPHQWKNPKRFDPDRFSPDKLKTQTSFDFVPFGFAGKRKCPGYRFAYAETAIILAVIVRTFKVKIVEGQKVEPVYGLVTSPKEEIWITLEKRN